MVISVFAAPTPQACDKSTISSPVMVWWVEIVGNAGLSHIRHVRQCVCDMVEYTGIITVQYTDGWFENSSCPLMIYRLSFSS